jgi:hypothetical protein
MIKNQYILAFAIFFYVWQLIANGAEAGASFTYQLKEEAFVTIVIEKEDGTRVRNLISCAKRKTGNNTEYWDGLDDMGKVCPSGKYCWRGVEHQDIGSFFQTAFNSPGNPPWNSQNTSASWNLRAAGSGGWLSDHGAPLCIFAANGKIFVGTNIAEAGNSLMELDLDGRKTWGTLWFSAAGANAVVTDNNIIYVAGEKGWIGDKLKVHRLFGDTHKFVPNPKGWWKVKRIDAAFVDEISKDFCGIRGMVITPDFIVLSLSDKGRLALFDKNTADFVKEIPLPKAGGICKNTLGTLFAISDKSVVKVDLKSGQNVPIITSGLSKPSHICVDSEGNFYISDAASSEQCVKVFSPTGKFLRNIGTQGGRKEGKFNPMAMGNPAGVAIDSAGKLWVAENFFLPKRISVWSKEGKLLKDFIGPPSYGGGGSLDPQNANIAFYKGMVFELKSWPEQASLHAVSFLPDNHRDLPVNIKEIPSYALRYGDSLYLVSSSVYGTPPSIYEMQGDHLVPRAVLSSVRKLKKCWKNTQKEFITQLTEQKIADSVPFLWSDLDGNGKASPSEISLLKGTVWSKPIWNCLIGKGLELQAIIKKGKDWKIIKIPPKTKSGILVYDFKDAIETPLPKLICALASDPQGNYIANFGSGGNQGDKTNMLAGLREDGSIRWTYPNPYPANWHNSPRPSVGDIQHTLNVEGFAKVKGFDIPIFQLNGNKGVRYLFTADGLFVCQLFGDMRISPLISMAKNVNVGLRLDKYSLIDECFHGWLGNAPDGKILQIEGKDSCNVMEVRGLETIKRIQGGDFMLHEAAKKKATAKSKKPIKAVLNPVFGIKPHEYKYKFPVENPLASFCVASKKHAFSLMIKVDSASPFVNTGEDFKTLFKTGDCIDIRLAANQKLPKNRRKPGIGDMRIIIANLNGKPVAVLYKFVVPGIKEDAKSQFASPVMTVSVDEIKILKKASIKIKTTPKGYFAQISIPWQELGFSSPPQGSLKGDIGILVADSEGLRTVARYYYFDQKSQIVSDLPSETMVDPSQWGTIEF